MEFCNLKFSYLHILFIFYFTILPFYWGPTSKTRGPDFQFGVSLPIRSPLGEFLHAVIRLSRTCSSCQIILRDLLF